jgi:DNA-binding cell septation regulator SpoVG
MEAMIIKHMTKLTKPGKIRAFFTVEIPKKLIIRDCKLIQNDDGSMFAGFPSRKYTDKDGNEKWTNIVEILDANLKVKIAELAKNEYQGTEPEPENDTDLPF